MNALDTRTEALLRQADPTHDDPAAAHDTHGAAALARILASDPAPVPARATRAPAGRRGLLTVPRLAAVATVAAAAVASTVLLPTGGSPALAATPTLLVYAGTDRTPGEVLTGFATAAAEQPPTDGRYLYRRVEAWSLNSSTEGGRTTSTIAPEVAETWVAADGSGRRVRQDPDPATPGQAAEPEPGKGREQRLPPGGAIRDARLLSTDPEVLAEQLLSGSEAGNNPAIPDPAERWEEAAELLETQRLTPALQAALWTVLAGVPGATALGEVTDRGGRTGQAVELTDDSGGLPVSHRLMADPATGGLIATEEVLVGDVGMLNVASPSVLAYLSVRVEGPVPDTDSRP